GRGYVKIGKMERLTDLLRNRLANYGPVPGDTWDALCSSLKFVAARKGHRLKLKPGGIYFLTKGLVKECIDWPGETQFVILRLLPEGRFLFPPLQVNGRHYQALEDCQLLGLDRPAIRRLKPWHPFLQGHYDRLLCDWLQLLPERVNLIRMPPDQRKKEFLMMHPYLRERVTNKDLANYLAISVRVG